MKKKVFVAYFTADNPAIKNISVEIPYKPKGEDFAEDLKKAINDKIHLDSYTEITITFFNVF